MPLKVIRLELARTPEFPQGSSSHGYEFVAPLDAGGFIDADEWKKFREQCTVRRFWGGEEETGRLRHVGRGWRFDYDEADDDDDEPFFRLEVHRLMPDNYVTIREHDGVERPFRVASVVPKVA